MVGTLTLPFRPWEKILELGGGDRPLFRPNADMRWGPTNDYPCDFNFPLPIPSESFDGVYSRFCLEHLSWRKVKGFLSEMHRILKPGGVAYIITANLLEQAKKLLEAQEWNDGLIGMLFGDQDYPENTHRCGFSPEYALRLFKEAGFFEVRVEPLPECATDMVILARKGKAAITYG